MTSSCRETVLRVGVGLVILYLTGFLILYDAIRKLISASVEGSVYGLDLLVMFFVLGTLLLTALLYFNALPSASEKAKGEGDEP